MIRGIGDALSSTYSQTLNGQDPQNSACRARRPAAAISRQKAVRDSDLIDSQPGVAPQVQRLTQVYLKVAVRAGYPLAAVHVDRRHSFFRKPPVRRTMGGWTAATEVQQEMTAASCEL